MADVKITDTNQYSDALRRIRTDVTLFIERTTLPYTTVSLPQDLVDKVEKDLNKVLLYEQLRKGIERSLEDLGAISLWKFERDHKDVPFIQFRLSRERLKEEA